MARTRIEDGADLRAARALRIAASTLTIAVLCLLLTGLGGGGAVGFRIVGAIALGGFAWSAFVVCVPVGHAALKAKPTAPRYLVIPVCGWLPAVVVADALVVGIGAWQWMDALGVAALAGVLAQAMLVTLIYLAPMLRGGSTAERELVRSRLEYGMRTRAAGFQCGVVLAVLGAAPISPGTLLRPIGWGLIGAVVSITAITALWPRVEPSHRQK